MQGESSNHVHRHTRVPSVAGCPPPLNQPSRCPQPQPPPPPPPPPAGMNKSQEERHRMAEQAHKAAFASHERAVFQEEVRARLRRREVARNASFIRSPWHARPECWAIIIGVVGLLWPLVNQVITQKLLSAG
ncbi:hypothetical protein F4779DRAFT_622864 [Xylariaceae sp. FL0662B]|nr:hypothetical protein F4779DRAFT_622864 [Xylariaceae sp. FL0662B]